MGYYTRCAVCFARPSTDAHHLFSNKKWARKKYGELIHHKNNIIYICRVCHLNKVIPKFTEQQFREAVGLK